jgi:DNA-binding PadR family transcriptional regulator
MEYVILALLDEEPLHGYELHHRLNDMPGISRIWSIKQALFYSKLERLEKDGFIEQVQLEPDAGAASRVVFGLTAQGKESILGWISTPVRKARDIRQVFLGKLIVARRYGQKQALDLIQKQRQVCQGWYDHLVSDLPEVNAQHMDELIVHTYRLYRDRSTLHWLDYLEGQIRETVAEVKLPPNE